MRANIKKKLYIRLQKRALVFYKQSKNHYYEQLRVTILLQHTYQN